MKTSSKPAKEPVGKIKPNKWTKTHKLGEVFPQRLTPSGAKSPFRMNLRDVGWHPDADDNNGARVELFIEETIGRDHLGQLIPFPVPASKDAAGKPVHFKEPSNPAEWSDFNRWILGGSIPDKVDGESPLTSLLRDLATACRRYNAALYRLRRLHYFVYHPEEPVLPPKNPHGDPDLPPPSGTTIDQLVADAEKNWCEVVIPGMNTLLDEPQVYSGGRVKVIAADMVEVNGYITGMRVTAETQGQDQEVGGSSSHVSISSAFSSSQP